MTCRPTPPPLTSAMGAKRFWRSLDELAGDPRFAEQLEREFPRHASLWDPATDRRQFLQLMAGSMALAGMHGCSSAPPERILPYVRSPENMAPGVPLQFATAMPASDGAVGLLVTSHMGRPTKVEGNPSHPASLGGTNAWAQASVLTLYDPDRSQTLLRRGSISTWDAFLIFLRERLQESMDGRGMHVLAAPTCSPTLVRQRQAFLEKFPQARWCEYEPASAGSWRRASQQAFGRELAPMYRFADADVVLALDADFLVQGGGAVRYARDFMSRRAGSQIDRASANRLYVVESSFTPTGAAADHRLPLAPSRVSTFADALAARLGVGTASLEVERRWIDAVAADLEQHRGRSIVLVGDQQPARVHAAAHAINATLGNFGRTVQFIEPIAPAPEGVQTLAELTNALNREEVNVLLILDANPAYDAPSDLEFAGAIARAKHAVHFGLYDDETAAACEWHIPSAHYLESWSDARAFDGTAAIVQPLIEPLYDGKTVHDLLSALVDEAPLASYDIVRATWQQSGGGDFDRFWHQAVSEGVVPKTAFELQTPEVDSALTATAGDEQPETDDNDSRARDADYFELALLPDPTIGDGRWANNGWLQELPKPLTKLTWGNAVLIAPATAERLGVANNDEVRLDVDQRSVAAPACIVPGHPPDSLTLHLGHGRTRAGQTGSGVGANAYRLHAAESGFLLTGVRVSKTGRHIALARTQEHHAIDGRNIVHSATLAEFETDPRAVLPEALHHELPSLYPDDEYKSFAWGMAIDLSKCMGCNACVVACQAENNVPIVGKEQVLLGREMHWLRLDLYFAGEPDNPEAIHQPMLCQHCEKAPCEPVCPVAATTHSDEGLNEMTYNRCIGTRYCSNNCPYKVRRFNFYQFQDEETEVLKLLRNPDVTVRSRGVMEKCTYCVQRIDRARISAKKAALDAGGEPRIDDGSLQTACQQACPTQAIVFGDINDAQSRVAKLKADPRNYGVLSELGTRPRTTYLVRLRNPNPQLG